MTKTAASPAVPKPGTAKSTGAPAKQLTPGDFVNNAEQALKTIGNNIRLARKEIYKLRQEDLAKKIGISDFVLRKIEQGESVPSMSLMLVLAAMRRHLPMVTAANPRVSELLVPADTMPAPFSVRPVAGSGASGAIAQARKSMRNGAHPPQDGARGQVPDAAQAQAPKPPAINPNSPFGHIAPVNRPR